MIIKTILFLFFSSLLFSQELSDIRIVKILDSNLFLSENKKLVKLADVKSPSLFSEDSLLAKRIMRYSRNNLLGKELVFQKAASGSSTDTLKIYLFKEYTLHTFNFNLEFLRQGYGNYEKSKSSAINPEYLQAESEAKEKNRGIWESEEAKRLRNFPLSNLFILKYSDNLKDYNYNEAQPFLNISYELYKQNKIFQISLSRLHKFYKGEDGGESLIYLIIPRFYYNMEFISINLGLLFFKDIYGGELNYFLFPVGGINIGILNRLYAHINFVDESLLAFWNYGITLKFGNYYDELSFGISTVLHDQSDERSIYAKARVHFLKNFVLEAQGKYNMDKSYSSYLFGIGFLLNNAS